VLIATSAQQDYVRSVTNEGIGVEDDGNRLHFGAAVGADDGKDLVDLSQHDGPQRNKGPRAWALLGLCSAASAGRLALAE